MTQDNQTYYLHYDQVGTLTLVTDINNNIIKEVTYDTFGNILNDTNTDLEIPFGFAGGMHDRDTELVHFGYREYDPFTGKWTAKDPIGFDGGDANLYGYVASDPINFVDPTGEIALLAIPVYYWLTGAGIAGVGATAAQPYVTDWLNSSLWNMAARGNVADTAITQAMSKEGTGGKNRCDWLKENANRWPKSAVKKTEKAWNCRPSRQSKDKCKK